MKHLRDMPIHKLITIVTTPFLYLFNILIIVFGGIIAYHTFVRGEYLYTILAIVLMMIFPVVMIILTNPKKLWQAIKNPIVETDKTDEKK